MLVLVLLYVIAKSMISYELSISMVSFQYRVRHHLLGVVNIILNFQLHPFHIILKSLNSLVYSHVYELCFCFPLALFRILQLLNSYFHPHVYLNPYKFVSQLNYMLLLLLFEFLNFFIILHRLRELLRFYRRGSVLPQHIYRIRVEWTVLVVLFRMGLPSTSSYLGSSSLLKLV